MILPPWSKSYSAFSSENSAKIFSELYRILASFNFCFRFWFSFSSLRTNMRRESRLYASMFIYSFSIHHFHTLQKHLSTISLRCFCKLSSITISLFQVDASYNINYVPLRQNALLCQEFLRVHFYSLYSEILMPAQKLSTYTHLPQQLL